MIHRRVNKALSKYLPRTGSSLKAAHDIYKYGKLWFYHGFLDSKSHGRQYAFRRAITGRHLVFPLLTLTIRFNKDNCNFDSASLSFRADYSQIHHIISRRMWNTDKKRRDHPCRRSSGSCRRGRSFLSWKASEYPIVVMFISFRSGHIIFPNSIPFSRIPDSHRCGGNEVLARSAYLKKAWWNGHEDRNHVRRPV